MNIVLQETAPTGWTLTSVSDERLIMSHTYSKVPLRGPQPDKHGEAFVSVNSTVLCTVGGSMRSCKVTEQGVSINRGGVRTDTSDEAAEPTPPGVPRPLAIFPVRCRWKRCDIEGRVPWVPGRHRRVGCHWSLHR